MQTDHTISLPQDINPDWKIGIVASMFYTEEMDSLVEGAMSTLMHAGIEEGNVQRYDVPGSFEIPLIGEHVAGSKACDALIGLGIIVEGQTHHARLLAEQSARGIMDVQLRYGIPFAFEVLYVNSIDDARARCMGPQNKGVEAAMAVLQSLSLLHT